jgi:hypothetical protein
MKHKWHMSPTHWGEGQIHRFCTEDDPAWTGGYKNGGPYIQYKTEKPFTFEEAEQFAEKLNKENNSTYEADKK